jgi:pSer/pThr/pTyr-binding forkhead associated (FHA) protein
VPHARLEITDALGRRIVPITKEAFAIGRRETSDLRLAGSEVSRDHAEIVAVENGFVVRDKQSRYGTYVNDERITERALLHGDRIRLGRSAGAELAFLLADTGPMQDKATVTDIGDLRQLTARVEKLLAAHGGPVLLDDVLAVVLDSAIEVTGAERGFIMLANSENELEFKLARGRNQQSLPGTSFATSRAIPEEVFRTGEPKIRADLLDGELANVHMGTVAFGIRNVQCVPLKLNRDADNQTDDVGDAPPIGVLYLDSRERGPFLSVVTRNAIETVATEAASAIENARRNQDKRKRPSDLRVAGTPQELPSPVTPAQGSSQGLSVVGDRVRITVTAPSVVARGTMFMLDIWAHLEEQRDEVIQRAQRTQPRGGIFSREHGPIRLARGTMLSFHLHLDALTAEDPEATVLWDGEIGTASFPVRVPPSTSLGQKPGRVSVFANGFEVAKVHFLITVGVTSAEVGPQATTLSWHRKAFASYATPDRETVLHVIQGMQKAAPELDVFLDVAHLRSGERWADRLKQEIPQSDIFYLFWSKSASRSEWVDKEWRCAYAAKGIDFIDPVPLVSPALVPPPNELSALHFNHWMFAYQRHSRPRVPITRESFP